MSSEGGSVTCYSQPPVAWGYDPVMKNVSTSVLPCLCSQKSKWRRPKHAALTQ